MASFTPASTPSNRLRREASSNQIVREEKCIICYEQFPAFEHHKYEGNSASFTYSSHGIFCNNCHFICNSDLRQFCSENVFPKIFHIRQLKGKVLCPLPNCKACFDPIIITSILDSLERKRYCNLIQEIVFEEDRRISKVTNVLRDMLTLSCPSCKTAVDPSPDACSAIMCLNCSCHYCNYCFALFNSKDNSKDKADCHIHVATHNTMSTSAAATSSGGDPFLPRELVLVGQKQYTEGRILQCLQLALSSVEHADDAMHLVAMAFAVCYEDIAELSIDPLKVWFGAISAVTSTTNPFLSRIRSSEQMGNLTEAGEDATTSTNHSGKIIANAIISNNDVAIRQILSAYQTDLDVNYRETVVVSDGLNTHISYPLTTLSILMGFNWLAIELIKLGADIYAKDNIHHRTVLMVILEKACLDVLDFLFQNDVSQSIDWNAPLTDEENLYNSLQIVARFGHAHLISKLLQHGANIESEEYNFGYPALSTAILHDNLLASIKLIRGGASIYHAAKSGATPIFIALERGQLLVIKEMVKYFPKALETPVKPEEEDGYKAIHVAIQYQMNHLLPYLIDEMKVDINDIDNVDRMSPFVVAILYGNTVAAKILFEHDADIYCSYFDRQRLPIFTIIERGYNDILQMILNKYPHIVHEPCDRDPLHEYRPLSIAVLFNQHIALEMLLKHGADVDYQDLSTGFTPIMCAAANRQMLNFQLLLTYLPNITLLNKQKRSLMYVIAEFGSIEMLYLLRLKYPDLNINEIIGLDQQATALHIACMHHQSEMVSYLLELGGDIEARNSIGLNVLQVCDAFHSMECKSVIQSFQLEAGGSP